MSSTLMSQKKQHVDYTVKEEKIEGKVGRMYNQNSRLPKKITSDIVRNTYTAVIYIYIFFFFKFPLFSDCISIST